MIESLEWYHCNLFAAFQKNFGGPRYFHQLVCHEESIGIVGNSCDGAALMIQKNWRRVFRRPNLGKIPVDLSLGQMKESRTVEVLKLKQNVEFLEAAASQVHLDYVFLEFQQRCA